MDVCARRITPAARVLVFDLTTLQPDTDMLALLRIALAVPVTGSVYPAVHVLPMPRDPGRFPASATYELVMMGLVIMQCLFMFRGYQSADSVKAFLMNGWVTLELVAFTLFISMIFVDFAGRRSMSDVSTPLLLDSIFTQTR